MPRAVAKPENLEDLMDEEHAEQWETVSEGFGTKIEWTVGHSFIGEFTGTREVELDDGGGGFSNAKAAEFVDAQGEKHWCWLPYGLAKVIEDGDLSPGRTVFIKCTGEQATKRGLNPVKTFTIKVKPV